MLGLLKRRSVVTGAPPSVVLPTDRGELWKVLEASPPLPLFMDALGRVRCDEDGISRRVAMPTSDAWGRLLVAAVNALPGLLEELGRRADELECLEARWEREAEGYREDIRRLSAALEDWKVAGRASRVRFAELDRDTPLVVWEGEQEAADGLVVVDAGRE